MSHVLCKSHRNKQLMLIKLNPCLKDILQVNAINTRKKITYGSFPNNILITALMTRIFFCFLCICPTLASLQMLSLSQV